MDNNIVIFVFGLAVTMTTLLSTIIYIIGSDHPDEPNKKAQIPRKFLYHLH